MFTTSRFSSLPHRNYAANGIRNAPRSRRTHLQREFDQDSPVPRSSNQSFTVWCNRFDNLIQRFEEPSSMVRWDSPLFTVPWNEELPVSDIWKAITAGVVKAPNAGTAAVRWSSCVTLSPPT
jgi:Chromatin associated protein KTI12